LGLLEIHSTRKEAVVTRRPRDRKQQILAVAAGRFQELGYHQAGVADVAAAVGIGPSALYRHFRTKQEMLLAIIDDSLAQFEAAANGPVEGLFDRLIPVALDRREFGALWEREAGHLPEEPRRAFRLRVRKLHSQAAAACQDGPGADFRGWAALSLLRSPSQHHSSLAPERVRVGDLLRAAISAVVAVELEDLERPPRDARGVLPASRREALLAAATHLFAERGYPSVSLADVGMAAGVTGPGVYSYFPAKTDLLVSALNRGSETLWMNLHRDLRQADNAADALERVIAGYTGFALEHTDIISVLISGSGNLSAELRDQFRKTQREYVGEWGALLGAVRPDLDQPSIRVLVHGALSLCNSLTRISRLRARRNLHAEVARCALLALLTPKE
jgi:AcrR family transcriptional regulator